MHRRIFKELTLTFIVSVFALLSLILISRGLQMRNTLLGLELGLSDVALLFWFMVPSFMILVLPISCMLSVFLTFLRMSTDRELVALKAGGVSILQMLRAPLFFSLICLGLALFISLYAISWGMNSFKSTILHIANTRAKIVVQPGVFNRDIFGLTFFARKVDPVSGHMQQIIFEDQTQEEHGGITVLAPEGDIFTDEAVGDLVFHLKNGRIYRVVEENVSILDFEEYYVRLDLSKLISDLGSSFSEVRPKEMSWGALLQMDKTRSAPSERYQSKVQVEIHKRWALPTACFVLGLFAVPLACAFEGVRRQLGVVLALVLFLLYYAAFSMGMTMAESGVLPSFFAVWMANALFLLIALLGLRLVNRESGPRLGGVFLAVRKGLARLFGRKASRV
ncbi:LPS export ABC transporter permease LptF [Desulfovibrio sp. OttesenSCG-928-A18]|nr:LPS export ABC transporter permease LptF [Desulfovibrio sp. OttesenSCG-928-A18]